MRDAAVSASGSVCVVIPYQLFPGIIFTDRFWGRSLDSIGASCSIYLSFCFGIGVVWMLTIWTCQDKTTSGRMIFSTCLGILVLGRSCRFEMSQNQRNDVVAIAFLERMLATWRKNHVLFQLQAFCILRTEDFPRASRNRLSSKEEVIKLEEAIFHFTTTQFAAGGRSWSCSRKASSIGRNVSIQTQKRDCSANSKGKPAQNFFTQLGCLAVGWLEMRHVFWKWKGVLGRNWLDAGKETFFIFH